MGLVLDAFKSAWRRYVTDGVPSSGFQNPKKEDIWDVGAAVESAITAAAAGTKQYATWAELLAHPGTVSGQGGLVTTDAGTHTDPVVGGTVNNKGTYSWSTSPAGWKRISDVIDTVSLGAFQTEVTTARDGAASLNARLTAERAKITALMSLTQIGATTFTASKASLTWTVSWTGLQALLGETIVTIDAVTNQVLSPGDIFYIDLVGDSSPFQVIDAPISNPIRAGLAAGTYAMLLHNNVSGTLLGPLADFARASAAEALIDADVTQNEYKIRDQFPVTMRTGTEFFNGASGSRASVADTALPGAFVFSESSTKGAICTLTLGASETFNMSFKAIGTVAADEIIDIVLDYELVSGSLATIGPIFWKINASDNNQGGSASRLVAEAVTGTRKQIAARFATTGQTAGLAPHPEPIARPASTVQFRPGAQFISNAGGAVVIIYGIQVTRRSLQQLAADRAGKRFQETFPAIMRDAAPFFASASGDPDSSTLTPLSSSFAFTRDSTRGRIMTVTLGASEAINLSFKGTMPVGADDAVDVFLDYELANNSLADIGPVLWKIDPGTFTQGGSQRKTEAQAATGVRRMIKARFKSTGSAPAGVEYPNPLIWPSGTIEARPGVVMTAGASGATVIIYGIHVHRVTAAAQAQSDADLARAVAMPVARQMNQSPERLFTASATGSELTAANSPYATSVHGTLGPCMEIAGTGTLILNQKALWPATPGRTYEVLVDGIFEDGTATDVQIRCWRVTSAYAAAGSVFESHGAMSDATGRFTIASKFRDTAAGTIVSWSPAGEEAAYLRFGAYIVGAAGPVEIAIKSITVSDTPSGDISDDILQWKDDAEAAAIAAEAAADMLDDYVFAGNNHLFGYGSQGWHSDDYSTVAGARLNGTFDATIVVDAATIGGQLARITNDNGMVTWRESRSIDSADSFEVVARCKAATGTQAISAGVFCYDAAGTFLAVRWCAADTQSVGTSFTEYDGVISGEGAAANQFAVGTKRIREVFRINGTGTVDLDKLRIGYAG